MSYIYKIINDINDKVYIGQTSYSLETRFKEHLYKVNLDRPLYRAMRKYGIDKFHIQLIEETSKPNEREIYWIQYYNSYHNGYNATLGGEGKLIYFSTQEDVELLIQKFNQGETLLELSNYFGCCIDIVREKLRSLGFNTNRSHNNCIRKKVKQIDIKTNEVLKIYDSPVDAARAVGGKDKRSHIAAASNGKRLTAYGYKWEYIE